MRKGEGGGLVYSTDSGRMCPGCRQPVAACVCRLAKAAPAGDGVVRVSRHGTLGDHDDREARGGAVARP